jgi:hypothetical protein
VEIAAGATTTAIFYAAGTDSAAARFILAHGAGAGQHSPFIVDFAQALSALGIEIVTFNFLYTEQRRRLPDRGPALEACYRAVIRAARTPAASTAGAVPAAAPALFIGGKSMGGRIATHVAAGDPALALAGLVLLGYPLHPPGRPAERRDAHLPAVRRPMLFVQGSRDAFGTPEELASSLARLAPSPTIHVVPGGDHSFRLPGRNQAAQEAVYAGVQQTIAGWISQTVSDHNRVDG